jgi:hypothetical protein
MENKSDKKEDSVDDEMPKTFLKLEDLVGTKDYAPKAEKGQDYKEFEKEELMGGSDERKSISFAQFVKTEYYWKKFINDPSSAKVVETAKAAGANPGPKKEGKKEEEEDDEKEDSGKDNAIDQQETGVDGVDIPKEEVKPKESILSPNSLPSIPLPKPLSVPDETATHIAPIDFSTTKRTIKVRNSAESLLVADVIGLQGNEYPIWKINKTIGSFDRRTFPMVLFDLAFSLYLSTSGLFVDVQKSVEPMFNLHKVAMSMGFDITTFANRLSEKRRNTLLPLIRNLAAGDPDDAVKEEVNYQGLKFEHQLLLDGHERAQRYFIPVQMMWEFYKDVVDDTFFKVKSLPTSLDDRYQKALRPRPLTMLLPILQARSNFRLIQPFVTLLWRLVRTHVSLPARDAREAFVSLLESLHVRVGTFDKSNSLAGMVSRANGESFLRDMFTCMIAPRFAKLRYELDMHKFDLTTLTDCFMLKSLVPKHVMSVNSRIDIDNYLAFHFLRYMKKGKKVKWTWNWTAVRNRDVNYLTENLQAGFLPGSEGVLFSAWGISTPAGDGWGNGGLQETWDLPRHANVFMNPRDFLNLPYGGKDTTDEPALEEEPTLQYGRLRAFLELLERDSLRFPDRSANEAFISMSLVFHELSVRVGPAAKQINEVLKKLSAMSIVDPVTNVRSDDVLSPEEFDIKPMAAFSMIMLTEFEKIEASSVNLDSLDFAWSIHEQINALVEVWALVKTRMPKPYFSKIDRIRKSFELAGKMGPGNSFFLTLLSEHFGAAPNIHDMWLPDASETDSTFESDIVKIEKTILGNAHLFGFAPGFVFTQKKSTKIPGFADRIWLGDSDDEEFGTGNFGSPVDPRGFRLSTIGDDSVVFDQDDVEELIQSRKIRGVLQDARDTGKTLVFNIPIQTKTVPVTTTPDDPRPFSFESSRTFTAGSITTSFVPYLTHLIDDSNDEMLNRDPEWRVLKPNVLFQDESLVPSLLHRITVLKEGFTLFDDFSVIPRN